MTLATATRAATLVALLAERAETEGGREAFTFLPRGDADDPAALTVTYADLDRRARRVAVRLQQAGPAGERALLLYPPSLEFVVALFGCLYAGWIAVPAYPPTLSQRLDRVRVIAQDAQARLALTTTPLATRLAARLADEPALRGLRWLATDTPEAAAPPWREPRLRPDSLAVLQYTSGSLARPRGVMLSHANLLHNTAQIERRFEITPDSRGLTWLPPYHDMGLIGGILQGVASGFPITLMPPVAFLQRPRRWLEAISSTRATVSGGPNFAYDLCLRRIPPEQRAGLNLSTWEVAFSGAEPVRADTLGRFVRAFEPCGFRPSAFYPCYGLAEATLMTTGGDRASPPVIATRDERRLVGCGRSIDDQRLVVVDPETCQSCPDGAIGEVWMAGPSVAQGYWGQPELTEQTFGAHLAGTGEGPFLRTGDLGFLRPDGELFVTGRLKALIAVGGRKVHAEDLEATLAQAHPAARFEAAVALGIAGPDGDERLVVVQEVDPRAGLDPADLARSIRLFLADAHQVTVSAVVLVRPGGIPRASSGKVQRTACREAYLAGHLEPFWEWPPRDT